MPIFKSDSPLSQEGTGNVNPSNIGYAKPDLQGLRLLAESWVSKLRFQPEHFFEAAKGSVPLRFDIRLVLVFRRPGLFRDGQLVST